MVSVSVSLFSLTHSKLGAILFPDGTKLLRVAKRREKVYLSLDGPLCDRVVRIGGRAGSFVPFVRWSLCFLEIHQDRTLWLVDPSLGEEIIVDERVVRPPIFSADHDVLSHVVFVRGVLQGKGVVVAHKVQSKGLHQEQNTQQRHDWPQGQLQVRNVVQEQTSQQKDGTQSKVFANDDLAAAFSGCARCHVESHSTGRASAICRSAIRSQRGSKRRNRGISGNSPGGCSMLPVSGTKGIRLRYCRGKNR
mmetsp:Transcript_31126/g.73377  ORF Transcript_31126/g.73377 Transcript_31126/m.73377 type:complete len:249 (+) Transcript_31126:207-953(+)